MRLLGNALTSTRLTDPLVVLVLVAPADVADPSTAAMVSATQRALDTEAIVLTGGAAGPSDGEALTLGDRVHASNVAVIGWDDVAHERVVVHLHRSDGWFDRRYAFGPADDPNERGRTLGLILASLISRDDRGEAVAPLPQLPPPPEVANQDEDEVVVLGSPPLRPPRAKRWAVDLAVSGALAGDATNLGPSLSARYEALERFSGRVVTTVRFGEATGAKARTSELLLGGGAAVRVLDVRSLALGLRSDLFVVREGLERTEGGTRSRTRWIGGVDILAEWSWGLTPSLAIWGGVGGAAVFGATPIYVGSERVGVLPVLRAVGELGGRVRF